MLGGKKIEIDVKIKKKDGTVEQHKYNSQAKFDKTNTTQIKLKLNNKTDRDILDKLEEVGNKQGYIKELIRKDIHG